HAGEAGAGGVGAVGTLPGGRWPLGGGPGQVFPGGPGGGHPVRRGGRGVLGDQVPPRRLLAGILGHGTRTPSHSRPARLWARTNSKLPSKIFLALLSRVATW